MITKRETRFLDKYTHVIVNQVETTQHPTTDQEMSATRAALATGRARLAHLFPWVTSPFIVGAPMRVMSGPDLALAISRAGGLGFIGPGAKPEDTAKDLIAVKELLKNAPLTSQDVLPVGVGFQLWNGDLDSAVQAVQDHRPCVAWLFAPRRGQEELDEWTTRLREASPGIQIWTQIGTLKESIAAASSANRPDALVIQGAEAGGHGRAKDGMGLMALLPEIADKVRDSGLTLIAAGGIADGRGVAAALALGAAGAAMGTRFLAATEARIGAGYQQEVVRASDGAQCTTRTMLYNHLRGTAGWPDEYSPRGIVNQSWHDHQAGVDFGELKRRHDEAAKTPGEKGWGPGGRLATYAGASVGLVHGVEDAGALVQRIQCEVRDVVRRVAEEAV